MVDWKRLWIAALCAVATYGGCIVLVLLPIRVFLALVVAICVCALTFAFYMILSDI